MDTPAQNLVPVESILEADPQGTGATVVLEDGTYRLILRTQAQAPGWSVAPEQVLQNFAQLLDATGRPLQVTWSRHEGQLDVYLIMSSGVGEDQHDLHRHALLIEQGLRNTGLNVERLSVGATVKLLYSLYNPGRASAQMSAFTPSHQAPTQAPEERHSPNQLNVANLVAPDRVEDRGDTIEVNEGRLVRSFYLTSLPDEASDVWLGHLQTLEGVRASMAMRPLRPERFVQRLRQRAESYQHQLREISARGEANPELAAKLASTARFAQAVFSGQTMPYSTSIMFTVDGRDQSELDRRCSALAETFAGEVHTCQEGLEAYLATMPLLAPEREDPAGRWSRIAHTQALILLCPLIDWSQSPVGEARAQIEAAVAEVTGGGDLEDAAVPQLTVAPLKGRLLALGLGLAAAAAGGAVLGRRSR